MIINFKQKQDTGKTAAMVATFLQLCLDCGYSPDEAIGNLTIKVPGYKRVDNEALRAYVREMVSKGYQHKIVLIDEADGVFPARFWNKPEQTLQLLGFWQDYKLFNYILLTTHPGKGVDLMIRNAISVTVIPHFDKAADTIYCDIFNEHEAQLPYQDTIYPASKLFKFYKRWEAVK